jgi:hypothetical protein
MTAAKPHYVIVQADGLYEVRNPPPDLAFDNQSSTDSPGGRRSRTEAVQRHPVARLQCRIRADGTMAARGARPEAVGRDTQGAS